MKTAFSANERSAKLMELAGALREYNGAMNAGRFDEAQLSWARVRATESDYFGRLPRPVVSCCPFDGEPLIRTFDPFGFDGPWWRPDAAPMEVPTCVHFCCLRGAVNFNGKSPRGGDFEAIVGPEAPYVIPRVLEKPGMVAVISQLEMAAGHSVYPVAYFAQRRPAAQELAANWPRAIFLYTTALAEHRWRADDDAWDFDLAPWLQRGKLRWCRPGDNAALSDEPAASCPHLEIKGERQRMVVQREKAWGMGRPERGR